MLKKLNVGLLLVVVQGYADAAMTNGFWPDANICNKTGEKISINVSNDKNLSSLEVPGGWGAFTKRDFDLMPNSCGEIVHLRKNFTDLSSYHLTIKDASGKVKVEQDYTDRPDPVDDSNTDRVFSFRSPKHYDNWETLFNPKSIQQWGIKDIQDGEERICNDWRTVCDMGCHRICSGTTMVPKYKQVPGITSSDSDLVKNNNDWSNLGELQYGLRFYSDKLSKIDSDILNLYVAPLGFNSKHEVDKVLSGQIYNNFKKVSPGSRQLHEVDGTSFDISKYPNLALCKVYSPSYSINETIPNRSTFTDLIVTPQENIYGSNETLVNNLDYKQNLNTMSFSYVVSDTTTHTVMHAWNVGTKITAGYKVTATVPGVGGVEQSVNVEGTVGYNGSDTNTSTTTTTKTINIPSQAIMVESHSQVVYRSMTQRAKIKGNLNVQFPFNDLKVYGLFARDGNCNDNSYKNLKDLEIDPILLLSDPKVELVSQIEVDKEKKLIYATDVLALELSTSYNSHIEVSKSLKLNGAKQFTNAPNYQSTITPFWSKVKSFFN